VWLSSHIVDDAPGEPTADSLPFLLDALDTAAIEVDSTMDEYMAAIGFVDPDRSCPLPDEDPNCDLSITSSLDEVEFADPTDLTAIHKELTATDMDPDDLAEDSDHILRELSPVPLRLSQLAVLRMN
jgi:hypothetical protein